MSAINCCMIGSYCVSDASPPLAPQQQHPPNVHLSSHASLIPPPSLGHSVPAPHHPHQLHSSCDSLNPPSSPGRLTHQPDCFVWLTQLEKRSWSRIHPRWFFHWAYQAGIMADLGHGGLCFLLTHKILSKRQDMLPGLKKERATEHSEQTALPAPPWLTPHLTFSHTTFGSLSEFWRFRVSVPWKNLFLFLKPSFATSFFWRCFWHTIWKGRNRDIKKELETWIYFFNGRSLSWISW